MKPTTSPVKARAHTNIALVKYWGKKDEQLMIPQNSSLSLTLDQFYTDTAVQFRDELAADQITFNGQLLADDGQRKISRFLNVVRDLAGISMHASVDTVNHVPTAAGLASSASGFAALAGAASRAAGLTLSPRDLSRLARRGSGSATRSIFGGFAAWNMGHDDNSSYGYPIEETVDWDIAVVAVVLNKTAKKISSRQGMRAAVATSPFYGAWVQTATRDFDTVRQAIADRDFATLGHVSEENAMRMHALNLSADPSFTYFNADTLHAITLIHELRDAGYPCYCTIDAGPNIKVLCREPAVTAVVTKLQAAFGNDAVLVAHPGPGLTFITD